MAWATGSGFDVSAIEEEKPKRNRRSAKASKQAASAFSEALAFIRLAADPDGKQVFQQYCRLSNGWASAFDGVMYAGHPIEDDLSLCPHLTKLQLALNKVSGVISISALENNRLSIGGGGFTGIVPCIPGDELPGLHPDPNIAPIDDRIAKGFAEVVKLAREDAETLAEASVLLRKNTVVATNRTLMLEYFHGNDLPPHLAVPQTFAKAVASINKKLIGFGWSEGRSITFHYEGGAWIACRLMEGEWPAVDPILNTPCPALADVPPKLFAGLAAVQGFSEDGAVHFNEGKIKSSYTSADVTGSPVTGASFEVKGLKSGTHVTAKLLKLAEPACGQIDYTTHDDRIVMYNNTNWLRGVLMKRRG